MLYSVEPVPDPSMLYENISYWNPGYEVIDTIVDCNNSNTRIKIKYHPKVPEGVVWMGHYQKLYVGLEDGDQVEFTAVGPSPILATAHFGYRQFLKNEGEEVLISAQELHTYLQNYKFLDNTYICQNQALMIYVPTLKEKRIILIATGLYPMEGVLRLGTTQISFENYLNIVPSAPLPSSPLSDPTEPDPSE